MSAESTRPAVPGPRDAAPHDAATPRDPAAPPPDAARAWLRGGLVLALVLSPLARPAGVDSFPFSGFPMFAHGRPTADTLVHHLLAVTADGARRPVPPRLVANDEVLQAAETLRRAVRGGKRSSAALCRKVAARLAADPDWADVAHLTLVSEKFDAVRYFAGDTAPLAPPVVRARCKVKRP